MAISETERLLLELERQLHQPDTRSNAQVLDQLLDESFIEFGASGKVFTKAMIIDALVEDPELSVILNDENVRCLAEKIYLVTYTSRKLDRGVENVSNRSSIWKRTDEGWKLVFHQGTVTDDNENSGRA